MNNPKLIEWILRIAVAGEFLGHGVFAIQGKKDWIAWFAKFGIADTGTATQLLFLVGILDIVFALLVLMARKNCSSLDGPLGFLDSARETPCRHAGLGFCGALGQLGSSASASVLLRLAKMS